VADNGSLMICRLNIRARVYLRRSGLAEVRYNTSEAGMSGRVNFIAKQPAAWLDADGNMLPTADESAITAAAASVATLEQQGVCGHAMHPRTVPSGGVKLTTYAAWFSRPGWAQGGEFWQLELSAPQLCAVQRLRLGSHSLPVETGRFAKNDRQDRCCTFCYSGAVGDKKHLLMECPAADVVRQRFACLAEMAVPPCMHQLVWGGDRMMVAEFMLACLGEAGLIGSSAL